ncbi:hypothetical protein V8B97DRAFT_1914471 [Scleroderma yunnanense]
MTQAHVGPSLISFCHNLLLSPPVQLFCVLINCQDNHDYIECPSEWGIVLEYGPAASPMKSYIIVPHLQDDTSSFANYIWPDSCHHFVNTKTCQIPQCLSKYHPFRCISRGEMVSAPAGQGAPFIQIPSEMPELIPQLAALILQQSAYCRSAKFITYWFTCPKLPPSSSSLAVKLPLLPVHLSLCSPHSLTVSEGMVLHCGGIFWPSTICPHPDSCTKAAKKWLVEPLSGVMTM